MFNIAKKHIGKRKHKLANNTKRTLIYILGASIIIFIITFIYVKKQNENYRNIKQEKDNYIVYTKYSQNTNNYAQNIPYINIKSNNIDLVNEDIDSFVFNFKGQNKCIISYEYDINGIILSVIVKVGDYSTEYSPQVYAKSYNINLDTLEVINNDVLLNFFGTDESEVSSIIESKFKLYYTDLVNQNYFSQEECNYDCFLKYRNVSNYLDNVNYYVKDGKLYVYKPFVTYSIYDEEEYFTEDSYKFLIAKED